MEHEIIGEAFTVPLCGGTDLSKAPSSISSVFRRQAPCFKFTATENLNSQVEDNVRKHCKPGGNWWSSVHVEFETEGNCEPLAKRTIHRDLDLSVVKVESFLCPRRTWDLVAFLLPLCSKGSISAWLPFHILCRMERSTFSWVFWRILKSFSRVIPVASCDERKKN